jgi:hypothetical protein
MTARLNRLRKKSERDANLAKEGLAGAKQAAEKWGTRDEPLREVPAGAEALNHSVAFTARVNSRPDTKLLAK